MTKLPLNCSKTTKKPNPKCKKNICPWAQRPDSSLLLGTYRRRQHRRFLRFQCCQYCYLVEVSRNALARSLLFSESLSKVSRGFFSLFIVLSDISFSGYFCSDLLFGFVSLVCSNKMIFVCNRLKFSPILQFSVCSYVDTKALPSIESFMVLGRWRKTPIFCLVEQTSTRRSLLQILLSLRWVLLVLVLCKLRLLTPSLILF